MRVLISAALASFVLIGCGLGSDPAEKFVGLATAIRKDGGPSMPEWEDLNELSGPALGAAHGEENKKFILEAILKYRLTSALPDVVPLLSSHDFDLDAREVFENVRPNEIPDSFLNVFDNEIPQVRANAAESVRIMRARQLIPNVVTLLQDPHEAVRLSAIESLEKLRHKGAVKSVVPLLQDSSASVRKASVEFLDELHAHDEVKHLISLLNDSNTGVRDEVLSALRNLHATSYCRLLRTRMKADPKLTDEYLECFGRLKCKETLGDIEPHLTSEESSVREAAVEAISVIDPDGVWEKHSGLLNSEIGYVRATAAELMGHSMVQKAIPKLLSLLGDPEEEVRSNAVFALHQLKADIPLATLGKLIEDSDRQVRRRAIRFAGARGGAEVTPILIKAYTDGPERNRSDAAFALGKLKAAGAIPALTARILDASRPRMSPSTVSALEKIGGPGAKDAALRALKSKHPAVIQKGCELAYGLGTSDLTVPLLQHLKHPGESIRWWAARALRSILADRKTPESPHREDAIDALVESLGDEDPDVRAMAATGLGRIGEPRGLEELSALLHDPYREVRLDAAEALCLLGRDEGVQTILEEGRYLNVLNALRKPDVLAKVDGFTFDRRIRGTFQELLEHQTSELGLTLHYGPCEVGYRRLELIASPGSNLRLHLKFYQYIVGDDSLRVISYQDALSFWSTWANSR